MNRRTWITRVVLTAATLLLSASAPAADKPAGPLVLKPGLPDVVAGAFCIVVLPDTQMYALKYPELFHAQTRWIAENVGKYNISYVIHLGDVTQDNNNKQWRIARKAFAHLDGQVPYAIVPGNHDVGPKGRFKSRSSRMSRHFPVADFSRWKTFGGAYDKEPAKADNTYHLFTAGGRQWLVLALEVCPRDDVVRWANEVLAKHPRRWAIVVTHAYLDSRARRYGSNRPPAQRGMSQRNKKFPGGYHDGEALWVNLLARHANVKLVLCGHCAVFSRLTSQGQAGNAVHQLLVDYQNQYRGGDGWLRLMQFSDGGRTVRVQDYSPVLNQCNDHPQAAFSLKLEGAAAQPTSRPAAAGVSRGIQQSVTSLPGLTRTAREQRSVRVAQNRAH